MARECSRPWSIPCCSERVTWSCTLAFPPQLFWQIHTQFLPECFSNSRDMTRVGKWQQDLFSSNHESLGAADEGCKCLGLINDCGILFTKVSRPSSCSQWNACLKANPTGQNRPFCRFRREKRLHFHPNRRVHLLKQLHVEKWKRKPYEQNVDKKFLCCSTIHLCGLRKAGRAPLATLQKQRKSKENFFVTSRHLSSAKQKVDLC